MGVSKDTVDAQEKFAKKNELTFPLLADSKGVVIRRYGVDLAFGIAKRKTFLIDSKGKIAKIYESVSPKTHAAEVAEDAERRRLEERFAVRVDQTDPTIMSPQKRRSYLLVAKRRFRRALHRAAPSPVPGMTSGPSRGKEREAARAVRRAGHGRVTV